MGVAHGGGDGIAVDGQVQGVGGLGQRDVGPVGHGVAHVDRGQATARVARLKDAAFGADRKGSEAAHLHLVPGDAARGVTTSRREGTIGVIEGQTQVRLIVGFDDRKLVEADAPVAVRQCTRKRCRDRTRRDPRVDHDEIVAQPMHLHEGQAGMACDI
jgi:hypothetical protein